MDEEKMHLEFKKQIENKIAELENHCSLEFVAVIAKKSSWLSYVLPKRAQLREVEKAAHRHFVKNKIYATEKRTGILCYISKLEKAVYMLADKGVTSHIPAAEWSALGAKLAEDFSRQNAGETFLEALDLLAKRVAPHFPPAPGVYPHLSNRVRIED